MDNLNYSEEEIEEKTKAITEVLKFNKSLKEINLVENEIGDEISIAIVEALKTNTSL